MYLKIRIRESLFNVKKDNWDQNTPSNSPRAPGTEKKKTGKKASIARNYSNKCEPHERSPCAPKFGEIAHEDSLHQERCARRVAWDLA